MLCRARTRRVYRAKRGESTSQTTKLSAECGADLAQLRRGSRLHFVTAQLLWIDGLEPAPQALGLIDLPFVTGSRRSSENGVFDEDRHLDAQRKRHRIGGASVDRELLPVANDVNQREERVVPKVGDDHAVDAGVQGVDQVSQEVVGHRPWREASVQLLRDRVRLEETDENGEQPLPFLSSKDHDGHAGHGIPHQPLDLHLDRHTRSRNLGTISAVFSRGQVPATISPRSEKALAVATRMVSTRPGAVWPGKWTQR